MTVPLRDDEACAEMALADVNVGASVRIRWGEWADAAVIVTARLPSLTNGAGGGRGNVVERCASPSGPTTF